MKKLIYGISFLALIGIIVVGCKKDSINPIPKLEQPITAENSEQSISIQNRAPDIGQGECAALGVNKEAEVRSSITVVLTNAYILKSDVLTTKKGIAYQESYYTLSNYVISNNYIFSEFELHYNALKSGVELASILIDENNTDVTLNNNIFNDLMGLVLFYEAESNPNEINGLISNLKNDLILNKDKTRLEILSFLED